MCWRYVVSWDWSCISQVENLTLLDAFNRMHYQLVVNEKQIQKEAKVVENMEISQWSSKSQKYRIWESPENTHLWIVFAGKNSVGHPKASEGSCMGTEKEKPQFCATLSSIECAPLSHVVYLPTPWPTMFFSFIHINIISKPQTKNPQDLIFTNILFV